MKKLKKEYSRGCEERNCLHKIEVQGEAASADGEAAANYPDMANIINEVATPRNQFSM